MDEKRLAEVEALANAATPGPWDTDLDCFDPDDANEEISATVFDDDVKMLARLSTDIPKSGGRDGWAKAYASQAPKDAAFMAAARTAVPELVAEVRRLRAAGALAAGALHAADKALNEGGFRHCGPGVDSAIYTALRALGADR